MNKLIVGLILLFVPVLVLAHPGNTDSYGCHTCRTNCSSWGLSYGQYHCHTPKIIPTYSAPKVTPTIKPTINKFSYTDADLDSGFLYECIQKVYNDKYLYRKGGINYYDSQCSYRLNRPVEEWIVTNGLATASSDIHKWAYWLIKFFNTVNK